MTATLLTLVVLLALVAWLGEPADGDSGSLTRMQTLLRVVETVWSRMFGRANSVNEATS